MRDTWAALLAPRRAAVVGVVGGPLLLAQAAWNADPAGGVLAGLVLILSALLVAPAAWRGLVGRGGAGWAGWIGYAAACLGGAVGAGLAVPRWAGFEDRFLTQPVTLPLVAGLFAAAGLGLGRDIEDERRLAEAEARAEALARDRERAELLALRAQLDPHTLYNTLSAIAEWCHTDPMEAERAILRLADLLRGVQRGVRRASWPLAEEWALCRDLLELYRARDPERYVWRLSGAEGGAVPGVAVPPLILLPLVENAVKHGPGAGYAGVVEIRVEADGAGAAVEICNPGVWRAGGQGAAEGAGGGRGGEGLALVRRRLALTCPGGRLEIGPGPGGAGVRARLWLPGVPG